MTAVSGSWIVPTVTGPSTGSYYSSVWVGIDGWGNSTVEQLGTEEDLVNGSPVYRAWWEMYSSGKGQPEQVITSMNVMPGDSITASVQYITSGAHAGQFYLSIVDNSRANDAFSIYASSSQYQSPLAQLSCAEWIVEAPTVGGSIRDSREFRIGHFHQRYSGDQRSLGPDQRCFLAVASTEHRLEWRHLRYDLGSDQFRDELCGDLQPVCWSRCASGHERRGRDSIRRRRWNSPSVG